ncbi:hypothetical protein CDIF29646_04016 (plasmid) [Clostridioides difficile]
MRTIYLTQNEVRAIDVYLFSNPCCSGYAYNKIQKKL